MFIYSHEYRDQKIGTKKMQETIFPEKHEECEKKVRKNRRKKVRKNVFYIQTNIVT